MTSKVKDYFKDCATLDEAKRVYYKLAMELHPDRGGDTADFQELLNQFHNFKPKSEKFKGEEEQWKSQEYAHIIEQLIIIPDIVVEVCGSWIWVTGNTILRKDEIKLIDPGESFRRGFNGKKVAWYFSPKGYRKRNGNELDLDKIRDLYGSQAVSGEQEKRRGRYIK